MNKNAWIGACLFSLMSMAAGCSSGSDTKSGQESASEVAAASRCCPAGFSMYSCQEPDGGKGFNCHNPQLGCASSLTCGGGCDFEVVGRCPVCDPLVCPTGQTFDRTLCRCVPSPVDAGTVQACTNDAQCPPDQQCVLSKIPHCPPNALCRPLGTCQPKADAGRCIQNVLCIQGTQWDPALCRCVPVPKSGSGQACTAASDCTGLLPDICGQCPAGSGGNGCAHWVCTSGTCGIALCDPPSGPIEQ
jgi:hypothetical protein